MTSDFSVISLPLPPSTNPFTIPFLGNPTVPIGYRAVVKHARLHVLQLDGFVPRLGNTVEDLGAQNQFSLLKNGNVIPGCQNRRACWTQTKGQADDPAGMPTWNGNELRFYYDLLVPIQLDQGDSFQFRFDLLDGISQKVIHLQGWIFPVAVDADNSQSSIQDVWAT